MAAAESVSDCTSELLSLTFQLEGLIGIAEVPQIQEEITALCYAGIVTRVSRPKLRSRPIVVFGQRLLVIRTRIRELATVKARDSRHKQRFHRYPGILLAF